MRIVLYDPANFTPYYLDGLARGLVELGLAPSLISSPPLFEAVDPAGSYPIRRTFTPWLTGRVRRALRSRRGLRRLLRGAGYPSGLWRTWRLLTAEPSPGILHVNWALAPRLDRILFQALRRKGWRIVYTVHDPLPGTGAHRGLGRAWAYRSQRALLASVDAAIVHTHRFAAKLLAAYPELTGRLHAIAHGATALALPTAAERERARRKLGIPREAPLVLFFGMLKRYKGLEHLLDAFTLVRGRFPDARLVIAGEPFMPLGPIQRRVDRLGLGPAVLLHPGFVPQREVADYFAAADLLAAPYLSGESSGVVTLAQSYGVPVIVSEVGGLVEFTAPDGRALTVPPAAAPALAVAISAALADLGAAREMALRVRERLQQDQDWTVIARATSEVYRKVCAST